MRHNPLKRLAEAGQSFWLDTISREIIRNGWLRERVARDGLRGVTSNPDILQKAIAGSSLYDDQISKLAGKGHNALDIYEALAVDDIRRAADILRRVYDHTEGEDGYISLEVSPKLAFDTEATVAEALRLWNAVNRPNLLIKVPATQTGMPAVRRLIAEGININVTLIFSLECYAQVMEAYISGLEDRAGAAKSLAAPVSVASFFLSRIDTAVDRMLGNRIVAKDPGTMAKGSQLLAQPQYLLGKAAIASARLAYQDFKRVFSSERFAVLRAKGARVQRPLWASTSTKNPRYPDTMYVEPLVGQHTVNTMPVSTMDAWRDHGVVRPNAIEENPEESRLVLLALKQHGIDLAAVTSVLQEDGITKFAEPFDGLLSALSRKRVVSLGWGSVQSESLGKWSGEAEAAARSASEMGMLRRLWAKDPLLWSSDAETISKISSRLGWISSPQAMLERVPSIVQVVADIRKSGFQRVVLMGMGGSSLCPEVCARTFGSARGFPPLTVLDTTSPDAVAELAMRLDLPKTLFIAASKSGTTIETNSQMLFFWDALLRAGCSNPGRHFVAVTDPGTTLASYADRNEFRAVFLNPPDIGGRFSALSCFGLVPMAMIGIDIRLLLERAIACWRDSACLSTVGADPAARLGVSLATLARHGMNKVTYVLSPKLESFGCWVEQLVAESTGKMGMGILPVEGEKPAAPPAYGSDRVFVEMTVKGEKVNPRVLALEKAGFPVVRIRLNDVYDLGLEFLRWEIATAVASACLDLNPFDEPNVTESKENTLALLAEARKRGRLQEPAFQIREGELQLGFTPVSRPSKGCRSLRQALKSFVSSTRAGDYIAIVAFLKQDDLTSRGIADVRHVLRDVTGCATTVDFGPRYLHSTGQFHKGGPNSGVFLMFVGDAMEDVAVPGQDYTFDTLFHSQALGDFRALEAHGRRAVLVDLGKDVAGGLKRLRALLKDL